MAHALGYTCTRATPDASGGDPQEAHMQLAMAYSELIRSFADAVLAGNEQVTRNHDALNFAGAFTDGATVFKRGDIEEADETLTHQPVATPDEDCICLAVTDAPLKFKSLLVRLVQPVLGI